MLPNKQDETKAEAKTKTYIKHSGWLGVEEVEVEIIETDDERVIVKALQGYPFDMWYASRDVPSNAKPIFHNDTYWYNEKIVSISQIIKRSNSSHCEVNAREQGDGS